MIHDSKILECPEIQTTQVTNSTCETSSLQNCDIDRSKLVDTQIHECNPTQTSMKKCTVTSSPLALRKFAPEIRRLIFAEAIDWTGKTPELIIALRGDPKLYQEAMDVLCRQCVFTLSPRNREGRMQMPLSVIKTIQNLSIE
jgi:hypothetical protein